MSPNSFIPAGRTSRIKKGDVYLQLQTEYAARPYPRITTTIINDGRVIHKVEKKLKQPVESIEEQQRIESAMRHLHKEISSVVEENPFNFEHGIGGPPKPKTIPDQLKAVPGVRRLLQMNADGSFVGEGPSDAFKSIYKDLLKSLNELMAIFDPLPSNNGERQKGVYEVEPNKLYFISAGSTFYFLLCEPTDPPTDLETQFKSIVSK